MKIVVSPMVAARAAAVAQVNEQFNTLAARNQHRDQAHGAKRAVAASVLAGAEPPQEFASEAALRGVTAAALAADIASRPNDAAIRELDRQRRLLLIAAATSPDGLPTK